MASTFQRMVYGLFLAASTSLAPGSLPTADAASFDGFRMASDAELESMRGGFEISAGGIPLQLAFSIEQLTYINDQLVAVTRLQLSDLTVTRSVTAAQGTLPAQIAGQNPALQNLPANSALSVNLIQNGPGNTFDIPVSSLPNLATVIQNTLDNQMIRTQTIINASLASASLARAQAIAQSVNQMLAAGLR